MQVWVAFFRALNVGGNNVIKMADLRSCISAAGGQEVATYIQSGNAVFLHRQSHSEQLRESIRAEIYEDSGFRPDIFLYNLEELCQLIDRCPFDTSVDPKTLHAYLLVDDATLDEAEVQELAQPGEKLTVVGKTAYFLAPNGISRSKLASKIPKLVGVNTTGRNWRTVSRMLEMAQNARFKE